MASRGGSVEYVASRAARLAMVRGDGAYRVLELDAEGVPTGHDHRDTSLGLALRWAALCYGHPPGTLCWKEMLGSPVED